MEQGIQLVVLSCQPESFEGQLIATATPTSNNPTADVVCVSLG